MGRSDIKSTILALLSILIGLLSYLNKEYALVLIGTFASIILITSVIDFIQRLEIIEELYSKELQRLNEKLKIHEQLIDIKSKISCLENKLEKNEQKRHVR